MKCIIVRRPDAIVFRWLNYNFDKRIIAGRIASGVIKKDDNIEVRMAATRALGKIANAIYAILGVCTKV